MGVFGREDMGGIESCMSDLRHRGLLLVLHLVISTVFSSHGVACSLYVDHYV